MGVIVVVITNCVQFINRNVAEYEDVLRPDDHERGKYVFENGDDSQVTYNTDMFEGDMANPGLSADTVQYFINDGWSQISKKKSVSS